jgi:hypothetical protein
MITRIGLILVLSGCAHRGAPPVAPAPAAVAAPQPRSPQRESSPLEVEVVEVKKVLAQASDGIKDCYEAVLTPDSHPAVALRLNLIVDREGIVRQVQVLALEPDIAGLVACFTPVLTMLRFAPDRELREIEFPVRLTPGAPLEE